MKNTDRQKIFTFLSVALVMAAVCISTVAIADVGNQNRYVSTSDSGGGSDDGFVSFIVGLILGLLFEHPTVGVPLLVFIAVIVWIGVRKANKNVGGAGGMQTPPSNFMSENTTPDNEGVTAQIQAIDPYFSADKFTAWVREVFIKLQQAWSERDWTKIRPFESEELFSLHNTQLDEYIRNNKINVIEKIGVKSCQLVEFNIDGDKEVVKVILSAVMRDYVIDATTRKVLESDPNKDWYMTYIMTFNRKKGVKTQEGLSNKSTTNCPNCGAPTQITSAGQCEYCGSIITTGEHDWVLTDIHSI